MKLFRLVLPACAICVQAQAAGLPKASLTLDGIPELVFDSSKDGCTNNDIPDLNPRAYRDAAGNVVLFGLHFINRELRGPDLSHLKIDCKVVLNSSENPDPAAFEGRNYVGATWTEDGAHIDAIIHHEYHAEQFGTCVVQDVLGCWYNALLAFRSDDGGRNFVKAAPFMVAAAPFRQEFEQGRHRGFFQPSNLFGEGRYRYFYGSTTGWSGQDSGACLFRSDNPGDSATWRAWDGAAFNITFPNPYATAKPPKPIPCKVVAPFAFPVGAVVRWGAGGQWVAVFQAVRNDREFPLDGFYYATGKSLTDWSAPRLLVAGQTLYNGACHSSGHILSYPSLLDEEAKGRNFDDTGARPWLYYVELETRGCDLTGLRKMMRVRLELKAP